MLNYFYDRESGLFELYYGDALLVELPHADPMTDQQASNLANELFTQHMENKNA